MSSNKKSTPKCLLVRANIALGLTAFVIGVAAIIFGDYDNLAARQASEAVLNYLAVGGLVYAAVFWIFKTLGLPCMVGDDSSA